MRIYDIPAECRSVAEALDVAKRNHLPNILIISEPEPGRMVMLSALDGDASTPGRSLTAPELVWLAERVKCLLVVPRAFEPAEQPEIAGHG